MELTELFDDFVSRLGECAGHIFEPLAPEEASTLQRLTDLAVEAADPDLFAGADAADVLFRAYAVAAAVFVFCSHARSEATGLDVTTADVMRLFWELTGAPKVARDVDGVYFHDSPPLRKAAQRLKRRRLRAAEAEAALRRSSGRGEDFDVLEARRALSQARRAADEAADAATSARAAASARASAAAFPFAAFERLVVRMAQDRDVRDALWRRDQPRKSLISCGE